MTLLAGLHAPATPLVGRERELRHLSHLLRRGDVRLVTLAGPPGTGKTRLGIAVAERAGRRFADGAVFVDLTHTRDAALVAPAIIHALGARTNDSTPSGVETALKRLLNDREMMLVMDNFEGVLPAGTLLAELLAACPRLRVLVTSREPTRIPGEHLFAVLPLATPDLERLPGLDELRQIAAVRLLEARVQMAQPGWRVTQGNATAVAELCVRLDGLPLAIELAAAWTRVLAPRLLLRRLSLGLLATDQSRAAPHHQTLQAAINWSFVLLDEQERTLFRRLAVFEGGWTFDTCHAVCASSGTPEIDTRAALGALIDKNLVRRLEEPDGDVRFSFLETIRAFAHAVLEGSGELPDMRRAHADAFVRVVEEAAAELDSPAQAEWLERLEHERGNLLAVLDWCVSTPGPEAAELGLRLGGALWLFWDVRGHIQEGRQLLKALLELPAAGASASRTRALQPAGWLAYVEGDVPDAERVLGESLAISTRGQDRQAEARSLAILGTTLATHTSDLDRATALLEQALRLAEPLGDTWSIGFSQYSLAVVAMKRGQLAEAWRRSEGCRSVSATTGNTFGIACSLFQLAWIAASQYDTSRAVELQKESLRLNWSLGNKRVVALCMEQLACLHDAGRSPVERARLFGAADALLRLADYELTPLMQAAHQQAVDELGRELDHAILAEAWGSGKRMTPPEAVAFALDVPRLQRDGCETGEPARGGPQLQEHWLGDVALRARAGRRGNRLLSGRELEVIRLIGQGCTNGEIAVRLCLSIRTVDNHVYRILKKVGVRSRTALAVWAYRLGITPGSSSTDIGQGTKLASVERGRLRQRGP